MQVNNYMNLQILNTLFLNVFVIKTGNITSFKANTCNNINKITKKARIY